MKKLLILITGVILLTFGHSSEKVYATTIDEGVAGFSRIIDNVSIEEIKEAMTIYNWTTDIVNFRKNPDINSNVIQTVKKREKVEVISTFNNWSNVKYREQIGWIRSDYLRDTELPSLDFTDEEIELIAKIVWIESRGESDLGEACVVRVIVNRVLSNGFSDDVLSVLSDENQFSSWKLLNTAQPTEREYEIVEETLKNLEDILDSEYVYFSTNPMTKTGLIKIGNHYFSKIDD